MPMHSSPDSAPDPEAGFPMVVDSSSLDEVFAKETKDSKIDDDIDAVAHSSSTYIHIEEDLAAAAVDSDVVKMESTAMVEKKDFEPEPLIVPSHHGHIIESVTQSMNQPSYDVRKLPQDTYSFFVTGKTFLLPCLVVAIQYSCFGLLLADLTNPLDIPVNVETTVRIAQLLLLFVAVLTQGDLAVALTEMVNGYDEKMEGIFEDASLSKWKFSILMKFLEGLMGLFSSFMLIMIQSDVYELLLTFAGVEFVYHLDDVAFFLCWSENFGQLYYTMAHDIDEKSWVSSRNKQGRTLLFKAFGMFLSGIALFSGFIVIASKQWSNQYLCKRIQVEMSDEQFASLGPLNGFYDLVQSSRNDDRVTYEQQGRTLAKEARGRIGFCKNDEAWVNGPCDNWLVRSIQTKTFDLEDTRAMPWQLQSGRQLEYIRISCFDHSFVSEIGYEAGNDANDFGFSDVCRYIVTDSSTAGFQDISSQNFGILESEDNPSAKIHVYEHHVYINENRDYIMVFLGVRWVLGSTEQFLLQNDGDDTSLSGVFGRDDGIDWLGISGWIDYISEPVDTNTDTGTPLDLQWYHSKHPYLGGFPGPDLDQRVNVIFRCGVCNSETNPCFNEGLCSEGGSCSCRHGASGTFCEIPPVGDGVCQDYFNKEEFEYDGGDCCASTCSGIECGVSAMNTLFGYDLEFPIKGFPDCKDPMMMPITIVLNMTTMPVYGDISFYSTWEVHCDGIEYLYSPSLGYREFLSIDVFGSQTIFVEPRVSCQVISRTKFYFSDTKISVYHGMNKDTAIIVQEYEWLSDDIDFEFPVLSACLLEELSTVADSNDILDSTSIQGQAAAWIDVESSDLSLCNTEFLIQLYALATINFSLDGAPQKNELSWLSSTNSCKWSGIFCDSAGSVSVIFLVDENLKGAIPSEISLLVDLDVINLSLNEIAGTIPPDLGNLTKLTDLSLLGNALSGSLPIELGNLINLKTLELSDNVINGTIPAQIGNLLQLTAFATSGNDLSGSIPTTVGNLHNMNSIYFHDNDLTGTIPTDLANLENLENLKVNGNHLTGFVPQGITSIESLNKLCIKGTNLTCYEDDLVCMSLVGDC